MISPTFGRVTRTMRPLRSPHATKRDDFGTWAIKKSI